MSLDILGLAAGVEVEDVTDSLGGGTKDTGVYPYKLVTIYLEKTEKGSLMANILLEDSTKRKFVDSQCIMSNKSGTLLATYKDKNSGKPVPLPGYSHVLNLIRLVTGKAYKDLAAVPSTKKVIPVTVWENNRPKDVNKECTCFDVSANVLVALLKEKHDKTKKEGDARVPTGETYFRNEVSRYFNEAGLTQDEIKTGATEPKFKLQWEAAYVGKEFDKTDKTAGATAGAPTLTGSGISTNTLDL